MWIHDVQTTMQGRAHRIAISSQDGPVSFHEATCLLEQNHEFREYLTQLLARNEAVAFRWETPPVTLKTVARPFEFVLTNDPYLEMRPDPQTFRGYFTQQNKEAAVLAIRNLSNTASLVVPRQLNEAENYTHFARFLRGAPPAQVHALWQCVAQTATRRLSAAPQWMSTAGTGVAWLHVRIENTPKYYVYRPYALEASGG